MSTPIITLTTDFGSGSAYVAQLKGVLLSGLRDACIVDVSHDVPAHSVRHAEVLLRSTAFAFPQGTVHIVVVDPGVGMARRPLAVSGRGMVFVGPDNGVLSGPLAQPDARVVVLDKSALFREPVSATFHGRDIFAPVACELAAGLALEDVGSPASDFVPSTLPAYRDAGDFWLGETLVADNFGNLLTNLPAWLAEAGALEVAVPGSGWLPTCRVQTYGEGNPADLLTLSGSGGFLELALREGSAFARLGGQVGTSVRLAR